MSTNAPTGWDELRRAADQLELELHLGGMEARERWRVLKPRLELLEKTIAKAGSDAGHAIAKELVAVAKALRELRDGFDHADS
jgi:hypothetical protein